MNSKLLKWLDNLVLARLPITSGLVYLGAQEGLFSIIPIESNTVISFYHGEKVKQKDFNLDSWDGNCYKIFDPSDYPFGTIDIPKWAQVDRCNMVHKKTLQSDLSTLWYL